jgi:hypothetical protein
VFPVVRVVIVGANKTHQPRIDFAIKGLSNPLPRIE